MIDNKILNKLWITLENQFENCYYILYRQNIAHIKAGIWLASFYHRTVNLMTMGNSLSMQESYNGKYYIC